MSYTNSHQLQSIGVNQKDTLVTYSYKIASKHLRGIYFGDRNRMDVKYTAQGQGASDIWYNSANTQIAQYKYVYRIF
ncbi:hypothetical protein IMSAG013_00951 [Clostridiales bacterium]|nr:hypothetical protein [Clostridiales bacterium]GFI55900.1 hypothetical protein IMSAG013_00951 [Clostridiales bacterium]